jgi:hypothetical protein
MNNPENVAFAEEHALVLGCKISSAYLATDETLFLKMFY